MTYLPSALQPHESEAPEPVHVKSGFATQELCPRVEFEPVGQATHANAPAAENSL